MIVVAIIGMLAAIAIPNFVKARTTAQKSACINNLRQLDGAIQEFALENKKATSDAVTLQDCTPYLKNSVVCPAGGSTVDNSYSVSDCQSPPLASPRAAARLTATSWGNRFDLPPEAWTTLPSLFCFLFLGTGGGGAGIATADPKDAVATGSL